MYTIISYLIIFSFLGWVWESCYISVRQKQLVNRGFVTGPVCTIYGFGACSLYILLRPVSFNYTILFFVGSLVATILEYVTAVVMEALFHTSWWDYSDQKFNYKGRICLSSSIAWGACSVMLFSFFAPWADKFIALYSQKTGIIAITIIFIIYIVDYIFAIIAAVDVSKQIIKLENMIDEMTEVLKSTRAYSTGEELVDRIYAFKHKVMEIDYAKRFSRRMEVREAVWQDRLMKIKSNALNSEAIETLKKITDRFESSFSGLKYLQNRLLRAYPNMKSKELKKRIMNMRKKF